MQTTADERAGIRGDAESVRCSFDADGKREINELVWKLMPPTMTLYDAEVAAIKIYSVFHDAWTITDALLPPEGETK